MLFYQNKNNVIDNPNASTEDQTEVQRKAVNKYKNLIFKTDDQTSSDSPAKKRLRRSSSNLKSFKNIHLRRQLSIKEGFQDRYQIQKKIGEGGHSVVHKCKDLKDGHNYAVKMTCKNDEQNVQGLKQQFRILASLNHQGIIKGYYLFLNQKKSTCHLLCQYCDFPNLRQYLVDHRKEQINQNKAGQIIRSILQAVYYLHQQRVCHRDLKPQNILYEQQTGQINIIDFEVARMPRYVHQKLAMCPLNTDL